MRSVEYFLISCNENEYRLEKGLQEGELLSKRVIAQLNDLFSSFVTTFACVSGDEIIEIVLIALKLLPLSFTFIMMTSTVVYFTE